MWYAQRFSAGQWQPVEGCISQVVRNRDGVGMLTFLELARMVDAAQLMGLGWDGVGC